MSLTPSPTPRDVVCSVCELPWPAHEATRATSDSEVGLEVCVRLLKALAVSSIVGSAFHNVPYPSSLLPPEYVRFTAGSAG